MIFAAYGFATGAMKKENGEPIIIELKTPVDKPALIICICAVVLHGVFCSTFWLWGAIRVIEDLLYPRVQWLASPPMKWLTSKANYPRQVWILAGTAALILDWMGVSLFCFSKGPLLCALACTFLAPLMFYFLEKVCKRILFVYLLTRAGCGSILSPETRIGNCALPASCMGWPLGPAPSLSRKHAVLCTSTASPSMFII